LIGFLSAAALSGKLPSVMPLLLLITVLFLPVFLIQNGDFETLGRVTFSLLPLTYLPSFAATSAETRRKWVMFFYVAALIVPVYYSYLQLIGEMPYYDVDTGYGRVSGGYSKPNNFVAFLFPCYMLGIYFALKKKRLLAFLIISGSLIIVIITGLRTAAVAYLLILVFLFRKDLLLKLVTNYYKYYLNFFVGLLFAISLLVLYLDVGIVDGIRGRIPMWTAHSVEFFTSNPLQILIGKSRVLLQNPTFRDHYLIDSAAEAHNNTLRTLVSFGLLGFALYCALLRWFVLRALRLTTEHSSRFIIACTVLYFILYSITNEPIYYSSILWAIFSWVFILSTKATRHNTVSLS
jgi:O-antigen ligase